MQRHEVRHWILATLILAIAASGADRVDRILVSDWKAVWELKVVEIADKLAAKFEDEHLLATDSEVKALVLKDLREVVHSAVGWGAFQDRVVDTMLSQCGADLLQTVVPYASGKAHTSDADHVLDRYSVCFANAMDHATAMATYAILEKVDEMRLVFERHGVEYSR